MEKKYEDILYWNDRHLYVEPAPEPNDIVTNFLINFRIGSLYIVQQKKDYGPDFVVI